MTTPVAHGLIELRIATPAATGSIHLSVNTVPGWYTVSQVVTRPIKTGLGTLLYRQAFALARLQGQQGLVSIIGERTRAGDAFWLRLREKAVTRVEGELEFLTGWL